MTDSPKPLGMSDFFALEAGEYLERLDGLLAKGDSPSADEIVRLARALRGSALMANQPAIARTAAGLEALARAVREGRRAWDPQTLQLGLRGVDDLKIFVRRAGTWTERGRPDPEGMDFRQFAGLLVKFMEAEPDAVSIGSLYYNDSGPHIVSRGVAAARPSTLGKLELVSHGEHLRQAADSLERAPSATQRELRAHTLGTTFRALANAAGGVLADRAAQFATAAREAVASGVAVSSPAAFAAELRRAGELLGGMAAPVTPTEPAAVDVRALLYRGDRALLRAQELRAAAKQASGDTLRELVEEVCDLVALALEPNP